MIYSMYVQRIILYDVLRMIYTTTRVEFIVLRFIEKNLVKYVITSGRNHF